MIIGVIGFLGCEPNLIYFPKMYEGKIGGKLIRMKYVKGKTLDKKFFYDSLVGGEVKYFRPSRMEISNPKIVALSKDASELTFKDTVGEVQVRLHLTPTPEKQKARWADTNAMFILKIEKGKALKLNAVFLEIPYEKDKKVSLESFKNSKENKGYTFEKYELLDQNVLDKDLKIKSVGKTAVKLYFKHKNKGK